MTNLIRLSAVAKNYSIGNVNSSALTNINLTVQTNDLIAIVGASGSGKSTLMNIIGLLDKADSGQYLLQGQNILALSENYLASLRNQTLGFVFQQFNLLPRFTARQNVALPLTYSKIRSSEINRRVHQVLSKVGMAAYAEYRPSQLSGGQQQRVAIARALVNEPSILLADEPTGSLDSRTGAEVMNLFLALHQEGRTILIVTHDEQVASLCSRRITLADGQIVAEA